MTSDLNDLFQQLIVGAFGLQLGVLAFLLWRFLRDRSLHIERPRPPASISVLIGVSWLALTLSALTGTIGSWNRDLQGWDVTLTLTLRLIGVVTGLPALLYVWRMPPAVVIVNEESVTDDR